MAEEWSELNKAENDLQIKESSGRFHSWRRRRKKRLTATEISDDPDEIREQIEETRAPEWAKRSTQFRKNWVFPISRNRSKSRFQNNYRRGQNAENNSFRRDNRQGGKIYERHRTGNKKIKHSTINGENPLPLVLIGLGMELLAFTGKRTNHPNMKSIATKKIIMIFKLTVHNKRSANQPAGISQSIGDTANSAYESVSGAAD